MGMGSKPTLSVKDAEAIKKNARGISGVAPIMSSTKQVMYGNQNWQTSVYGITTPYLRIKNYEIKDGRTFTKDDESFTANVVYRYTIRPATLSVKVENVSREYGEDNPEFNVTYSGFLAGENESVLTTLPTISTTATASPIASNAYVSAYKNNVKAMEVLAVTPLDRIVLETDSR